MNIYNLQLFNAFEKMNVKNQPSIPIKVTNTFHQKIIWPLLDDPLEDDEISIMIDIIVILQKLQSHSVLFAFRALRK